ncbi:MAG: hypothetical protein V4813_18245 [Gemmatimonadota bacterium]
MTLGDSEQLRKELDEALPRTVRDLLVAAMDSAHRDAGLRFDVDAGSDAQLYGFMVYKFVAHQVSRAIEEDPSLPIRVVGGTSGAFRLRAGRFLLAPYSCGRHAPDDPTGQFPSNDKGAGLLADINAGQGELFAGMVNADIAVVLGHYGNWESGLEAVFLKVPIAQRDGQISEWDYVEEVFRLGGTAAAGAPTPPTTPPVLPPPAVVVRPNVLPFKRKPQRGAEGEGA